MQQETELAKDSSAESRTLGMFPWRVIGLVGFAAPWIWVVRGKSDLGVFVDPGSLAVVGVGSLALLLAVFGGNGTQRAVTTLIRGARSGAANVDALHFFRLGAAFALGCGFFATLVGLVVMLQTMSNPSAIGPTIAAAVLPQLYGVALALMCLVGAAVLAQRGGHGESTNELSRLGRQSVGVAGIAASAGLSAVVLVLFAGLLSVSEIRHDPRFEQAVQDLRVKFPVPGLTELGDLM